MLHWTSGKSGCPKPAPKAGWQVSTTHSSCSELHSKPHLRGHKWTGGAAWCIPLSSCTPRHLTIQPKLKEISVFHSNFSAGSVFAAFVPVLGKKFYLHIKEDSNEIELGPRRGEFCINQESGHWSSLRWSFAADQGWTITVPAPARGESPPIWYRMRKSLASCCWNSWHAINDWLSPQQLFTLPAHFLPLLSPEIWARKQLGTLHM